MFSVGDRVRYNGSVRGYEGFIEEIFSHKDDEISAWVKQAPDVKGPSSRWVAPLRTLDMVNPVKINSLKHIGLED